MNRQYDPVNFAFISNPAPVSLNSLIKITFPVEFLTISSTAAVTCTNSAGADMGCTLNSPTRTITIANYYKTSSTLADSLITIKMSNIINAYKSGASSNFYWEITDSAGTIIDQGPAASNTLYLTSLTFTGGTFQCKSILI